jgi:hypothetical protein
VYLPAAPLCEKGWGAVARRALDDNPSASLGRRGPPRPVQQYVAEAVLESRRGDEQGHEGLILVAVVVEQQGDEPASAAVLSSNAPKT